MPENSGEESPEVVVYQWGLVALSCCAHKDVPIERVTEIVNQKHPTGLDHGWVVSDEPFRNGIPNPCPCELDENRVHYLFTC